MCYYYQQIIKIIAAGSKNMVEELKTTVGKLEALREDLDPEARSIRALSIAITDHPFLQSELADAIGVSDGAVSQWKNEYAPVEERTFRKIVQAKGNNGEPIIPQNQLDILCDYYE